MFRACHGSVPGVRQPGTQRSDEATVDQLHRVEGGEQVLGAVETLQAAHGSEPGLQIAVIPFAAVGRDHPVVKTRMERLVRASDVAWTIVRPPRLKEGGAARGYRVKVDARPRGAMSMERVDLATFLLDEAENGTYARSIVGVGSA